MQKPAKIKKAPFSQLASGVLARRLRAGTRKCTQFVMGKGQVVEVLIFLFFGTVAWLPPLGYCHLVTATAS